jgi:hypothetical protein
LEIAQVGRVNLGDRAIYVGHTSSMVQQSIKQAGIKFDGDKEELNIFAYVCRDGETTYSNGRKVGDIRIHRVHVPRDETVYWRDLVSTIAISQAEDSSKLGIGSLPTELKLFMLTYLAPQHMSLQAIQEEFKWNVSRIQDLRNPLFDEQLVYCTGLLGLR